MIARGEYRECFRLIEEKLDFLYSRERWPENFMTNLGIHRRCYSLMNMEKPYGPYLEALLKKHDIPFIFSDLMSAEQHRGRRDWNQEFFKEHIFECERQGRLDAALAYARLMAKVDPINSNAWFLRGYVLRLLGHKEEAMDAFERALELNKRNYAAGCAMAELLAEKSPAEALGYVGALIAQSPSDAELRYSRAQIYLTLGNLDKAAAALNEAIALVPLSPRYLFARGEIYEKKEQPAAAIRQYTSVINIEGGNLAARTRLAQLLAETQPAEALRHITFITNANPNDKKAALSKARLHERSGDKKGAREAFRRVLELDENCGEANTALGRLTLPISAGEALPFFQKAAALLPNEAAGHLGAAKCHSLRGEDEAAIAAYRAALRLEDTNAEAHADMGRLLRSSDPKAAFGHYEKAARLDTLNAEYHRIKGDLLAEAGAGTDAVLECYNTALKCEPNDAGLHLTVAGLLESAGRPVSAAERYENALSLNSKLGEAHIGLARLQLENRPASALAHASAALGLSAGRGAELYCLKARAYLSLAKHPDQIREARVALASADGDADSGRELAQLQDGGPARVAMMLINRALEKAPENAEYLCVRAGLLHALGNAKTALDQYEKALAADANNAEAHFGIGQLLAETDEKKALEHLTRAETLAPREARYTAQRALVMARDPAQYTQALDCLDDAIAKDKERWDILLMKGRLLEEHDEPLNAIDSYRRALLVSSNCLEANERMGVLMAPLSPSAALVYTDKAIELSPDSYRSHIWRGRLLHELGDMPGGEAAVAKGIELGGESDEVFAALANILSRIHPHAALEYCKKAAAIDPENPAYPLLGGNILLGLARPDEATARFEEALRLNSGCHEAYARIAEIHYKAGRLDDALREIARALQINGGNASYHYINALVLYEKGGRLAEALASLQTAVGLAPGKLAYREKHIELLGKKHAFIQLMMQKKKLEKLRARLRRVEEQATGAGGQ